jgi:hypothetical protein
MQHLSFFLIEYYTLKYEVGYWTHLYWLVYPIELETKGMTDIVRHALYPDLHLEI